MQYFLFVIYLIAGCYIIYRHPLLKKTELPVRYWIAFLCLKTCAGCYYGYWYSGQQRIATSDTWRFHNQALEEYQLLFRHPMNYLVNLFQNSYNSWGGLLSSHGYWNNLKDNLIVKMISVMDIISGGHYYVNVVIYSFITFFGFVYYYLACKNVVHKTPGTFTTLVILLTPSCLFWTSGIHKDGLVLLFTGLFFWCCSKHKSGSSFKAYLAPLIFSLTGIFLFRNYLLLLLMPPFVAYLISRRYKIAPLLVYPLMGFACTLLFFLSSLITPKLDLPAALVARKNAFEILEGNSRLPSFNLLPSFNSFAKNFPIAIDHSILRPYVWNAKNLMEVIAAGEMVIVLGIVFVSLLQWRISRDGDRSHFQWLIVYFCVSVFLVIGYSIPFSGAIVRYRAIFLMLLASVCTFNWPRRI